MSSMQSSAPAGLGSPPAPAHQPRRAFGVGVKFQPFTAAMLGRTTPNTRDIRAEAIEGVQLRISGLEKTMALFSAEIVRAKGYIANSRGHPVGHLRDSIVDCERGIEAYRAQIARAREEIAILQAAPEGRLARAQARLRTTISM